MGKGWKPNFEGGVLFSVFYANLKFREILVQLCAMRAKYCLILVSWVVLLPYMCRGMVYFKGGSTCWVFMPCWGYY